MEGESASATGRKWWVNGGLREGLELVGSTTVHLHGLPGKQQTDVSMEVDLPRLRTLEPGWDWERKILDVENKQGKTSPEMK